MEEVDWEEKMKKVDREENTMQVECREMLQARVVGTTSENNSPTELKQNSNLLRPNLDDTQTNLVAENNLDAKNVKEASENNSPPSNPVETEINSSPPHPNDTQTNMFVEENLVDSRGAKMISVMNPGKEQRTPVILPIEGFKKIELDSRDNAFRLCTLVSESNVDQPKKGDRAEKACIV